MPLQAIPAVTVLIPAYNAAAFLQRAVCSALKQSVAISELLIVDDASIDGTYAVMQMLAEQDSRVRIYQLAENGGPSAARNLGLDVASGQWIAMLDADDAFLPERVEAMVRVAIEGGADIVLGNFQYYDHSTQVSGPPVLREGDEIDEVSLHTFLTNSAPSRSEPSWGLLKPMFKKAFLDREALRYPLYSRHGEDFLFLVEALMRGARCILYRRSGYLYTVRESGLSRTVTNYPALRRHITALMKDIRIKDQSILVKALSDLAAALNVLMLESDLKRYLRDRDYRSVVRRLVNDARFRAMLGAKLVRRIRRSIVTV